MQVLQQYRLGFEYPRCSRVQEGGGVNAAWSRHSRVEAGTTVVVVLATVLPTLLAPQSWWFVGLTVMGSAPLYWRRAALLPVGFVVGAATTALALTYHSQPGAPILFLPYGALVWTYTFAAVRTSPRGRVVGLAGLLAGVPVSLVLPHENLETFRYITMAFIAAFALGASARARREQRAAEDERTLRLAEERTAAIARERTRIARDMHDIVTHSVGLIIVQAEAGPLVLRSDPTKAEAVFDAIGEAGRDAILQLRVILKALRGQTVREPQPGIEAVHDLIARARQAGLDATFEEHGSPHELPVEVGIATYRIVQEALTNILRHAAAGTARVRVGWTPTTLTVEVTDDGKGCERVGGFQEGHGIVGMRERAESCGGTLSVDPTVFTVTASLPIG